LYIGLIFWVSDGLKKNKNLTSLNLNHNKVVHMRKW
jgi:hypothetical protein